MHRPGLLRSAASALLLLGLSLPGGARASENVPRRPFAQWADLPAPQQFIIGVVYQESEAYRIFAQGASHNITWKAGGENYGIDVNQGYLALQYGIAERWAADLNVGATTAGWRFFDNGGVQATTGLMDSTLGIRYQIFNEAKAASPWTPTLTFRLGGVFPGTYDEDFAFAPGLHSFAVEPSLIARKHFGWPGLGAYADALYRWNPTEADQYIVMVGLLQEIKGWELAVGFRHLQTISGSDLYFPPLYYPRDPREINEAIEAGFSYTTSKRHLRFGFHSRATLDGNNTDRKFWVGGSVDIPLGGRRSE